MAKGAVTIPPVISEVLKALPHLAKLPSRKFWVDYDQGGDVLYLSFDRPQRAVETKPVGDHFLLRYRGRKLVGVTILHASAFLKRAA